MQDQIKLNQILQGLNIHADCVSANLHRHLLTCDLNLHVGQKVKKIESFSREIGLAMKSVEQPNISHINLCEKVIQAHVV